MFLVGPPCFSVPVPWGRPSTLKKQRQCKIQLHSCRKRTSMFLVGPPCFFNSAPLEGPSHTQKAMTMAKLTPRLLHTRGPPRFLLDLHVFPFLRSFGRARSSHKKRWQCQSQLHSCGKRTSMFLVGPPCFSISAFFEVAKSHTRSNDSAETD